MAMYRNTPSEDSSKSKTNTNHWKNHVKASKNPKFEKNWFNILMK
jgi:hypothetical protein